MSSLKMLRELDVKDEQYLFSTRQISYLFKITVDMVIKWKVEPCAKRGATSLYYLPEVLDFRFGPDGQKLDPSQEKARLDHTRRQIVELQLAKLRGDLVEVGDVCKEVEKEYIAVRQGLLAIPSKLANQLVPLDSPAEIQGLLMDAFTEALKELTLESFNPPEGTAPKNSQTTAAT